MANGPTLTHKAQNMSEEKAVRGSDEVMRELVKTSNDIEQARRVLIVGAGAIPRLLGELNDSLASLGYKCVPIEPATGLYKTFADLLACPVLSALHDDLPLAVELAPAPQVSATGPVPSGLSEAIPFGSYLPSHEPEESPPTPPDDTPAPVALVEPEPVQDPVPAPAPASKPDMRHPANWQPGDVFTENPRFTLPHKQRRWVLESIDEVDVELRSPHTSSSELLTLEHFVARFVFVERPAVEQSAA